MMDAFDDHGKLRIALAQREMAEARIRVLEEALRALGRPHNGTVVAAFASSFRDQWFDSQEDLLLGKH